MFLRLFIFSIRTRFSSFHPFFSFTHFILHRQRNAVSFNVHIQHSHRDTLIDFDDLPGLYNLASLLVLPSIYEGFGIPLVEAMACGTPVACAAAGAMPEVVGRTGRLFDPFSVDSIASALTDALNGDVGNAGVRAKCLERASNFSWENTAGKTYKLYKAVAAENRSSGSSATPVR